MKEKKKLKIKNMFKSRVFFFVIGALIFGTIGVGATTLLYSKDVTYDNSSSGMSATTVQGALDELYAQASSVGECPEGYICSETASNQLKNLMVTTGDGLYTDIIEEGRYYYRGSSPDNYIKFNDETWRIISVESDGSLKIIKNETLTKKQWDTTSNRSSSTDTYCLEFYAGAYYYFGCNAWAATSNLVGTPSNFIQYAPNGNTSDSKKVSGKVTKDASLNTYLNTTYYNSLSLDSQRKVVKGTFNISTPGNVDDTETLEIDAQQEKQYQWKGYVALMTVTELLRASTSTECISLSASRSSKCDESNWLWLPMEEWTLSPYPLYDSSNKRTDFVWEVYYSGSGGGTSYVDGLPAYVSEDAEEYDYNYALNVRPVLHLSSNITLSGSGTSSDPYTIG